MRNVMSRRQYLQWAAGAGASAALGIATPLSAWAQIADAAKPAKAPRLVVVGGAITEVVYALGAEGLLVGTDTTSLFPEAANHTPKVGYLRQLSAEGLLSLRPDVIVGSSEAGPATVLQQVQAAGVKVELVPAEHSFAEVLRKVAVVGAVTGREQAAQKLSQSLQATWSQVQASVAGAPRKPRALFILSHNGSPMVAGRDTAADALLQLAGAENVVHQFAGYRPLTAEAMSAVAPEVIVNSTQGIEALGGVEAFWRRPELALTPAYARKALVMKASHLLGFGPRMPEAVRALHQALLKATA